MTIEELRESLLNTPKNGYTRITPEQKEEMESYCAGYMAFMDACKTEREATTWAVAEAEKRGIGIISCMGTGNKLQSNVFECTDIAKTSVCPLAKVMRRLLKENGVKIFSPRERWHPIVLRYTNITTTSTLRRGRSSGRFFTTIF